MFTRIRKALRARRLAGCCDCGRRVVRYVYVDRWRGRRVLDESYCDACGPIRPEVLERFDDLHLWDDYGRDREVTIAALEDHIALLRYCALPDCHSNVYRHPHAATKAR